MRKYTIILLLLLCGLALGQEFTRQLCTFDGPLAIMPPDSDRQIDDSNISGSAGIKASKLDLRELEFTNMLINSGFEDWAGGASA